MSLPVPAIAPKPAAAPAAPVVVAPVVPVVTPPVVATPAAPVVPVVEKAAPAKAPRKSMTTAIGEKFDAAIAKSLADKKAAAAPAVVNPPVEPVKTTPAVDPAKPIKPAPGVKVPDDSDAAITAEIETKTQGMTGAAKQAFADLRFEQRDLRRQLADRPSAAEAKELNTQLAAIKIELDAAKKATPTSATEVVELRDKLTKAEARDVEREQELMVAKVERTEAFKNAVTTPLKAVDALAKKLAKKYDGVSETALLAALHDSGDGQSDLLIAAVDGMNEIEKQQVYNAATKVAEINEKAEVLRSQAAEALAKIDAKKTGETEAQKAATTAARKDAHSSNWKKLKEAIPTVLDSIEGTDSVTVAWGDAQKEAERFSLETDFGTQTPVLQSEIMQRASVYPLLVGALTSVEAQLAESKAAHATDLAELTKFREKMPGGASDRLPDGTVDAVPGKKSFVDRVSARMDAAQRHR